MFFLFFIVDTAQTFAAHILNRLDEFDLTWSSSGTLGLLAGQKRYYLYRLSYDFASLN